MAVVQKLLKHIDKLITWSGHAPSRLYDSHQLLYYLPTRPHAASIKITRSYVALNQVTAEISISPIIVSLRNEASPTGYSYKIKLW